MFARALIVCLAAGLVAAEASAQGLAAHLRGQVIDATGGVVPGATVMVKNTGTNGTRETLTSLDGAFAFPDLVAGVYDLSVSLDGFKTSEQKGITLASTEPTSLPAIVLEVGGVEQRVTVRSEAPLVQTSTGARSAVITRENIEEVPLKGRDFVGMLELLPGVIDTSPREAPTWSQLSGLSVNGRTPGATISYDGISNRETGSNNGVQSAPGLDSISEVRVQSANFQAEYGRNPGASIVVVTRSGSKNFRGSAAFYKRDGALNGNEFARKAQCAIGRVDQCEAAPNNVDNFAWTIGGPVLVPGTGFNRNRNRLFFFWSQDVLTRTDPGVPSTRRMPTALERSGDFSQTRDSRGMIFIRDPQLPGSCSPATGGPACFPGNIIPPSRMDPTGHAFVNMFPLPNGADPTGANQYNYTTQLTLDWPRNDQVLRVDWNVGPQTTVYGRLQFGYDKRAGPQSFAFTGGWPQMDGQLETESIGYVNTLLHSFNATTFLEATAGVNWGYQYASAVNQAALDANTRSKVLPGLPQFFPDANPLDLLPNATFNGPASLGTTIGFFQYERRFPYYGYNTPWNFLVSLTKLRASHTIKAGVFVENTTRPVRQRSLFNGTINFNNDGSNPLNTNIGFANALLGTITSYQKADGQPAGHGAFVNTEFYAQDNWRLTRRLTLDIGARFYWLTPTRNHGGQAVQFEADRFDASAAPQLFQPISTPQGRRAVNPLTGEVFPAVYVGRLVPGSGDFDNGLTLYDETPHHRSPFEIAPRVGFAWDVTGDGRTAIRGGAGVFYDRYSDDNLLELIEIPPLVRTYTTGYTTIAELLGSPLTETPSAVRRFNEFEAPVVYNWSLGVQREIGWKVVGDVAYVGNAARHQAITRELNGRPYGYTYLPSSLDSTNVQSGQAQPLPDDLLRPYRGLGSIAQREFTGYSDYHSLQVSVRRRRGPEGLSFGASYTYQIANKTLGAIDPFLEDNRARNYNSAGRRAHSLAVHYTWLVPNLADSNSLARAVLNDWQFSGVTSYLSGAQGGFTYAYFGVPSEQAFLYNNGSIGGGPNRPRIVCDPTLPRSERTFHRQFRTECIAAPEDEFHFGTARGDEFEGPGAMNWDLSAFKNVRLNGTRRLQFRAEFYNAFNTNQWTTVYTNALFDYKTGALTNPAAFGPLTGETNSARRVQLGVRFEF
jgi:hypothetical protein